MTLVSYTKATDGSTIDASDINTPLDTIYNDHNGNIDSNNLADNAVTTAKITDANVTTAKIADANVTPVKWTNPYKFSAYCSTGKAVNTTTAIVDLQTELFDTNNNFASSRYTAPVAGFYQINAQAWWASAGAGTTEYASIHLRKNGSATNMPISEQTNGSGDANKMIRPKINYLIQLAAGDYIELWITTVGTRDLSAGQSYTYMNGYLVSQT